MGGERECVCPRARVRLMIFWLSADVHVFMIEILKRLLMLASFPVHEGLFVLCFLLILHRLFICSFICSFGQETRYTDVKAADECSIPRQEKKA